MNEKIFNLDFASDKQVIEKDDLFYFGELIKKLSGIRINAGKYELVRSRLRRRIIELGFESYSDYRKYLMELPEGHLEFSLFVNKLTTNKTDFFRESIHFDFLEKVFLPEWLAISGKRILRVWSAACSTGEEAYTLSMVLDRIMPNDCDYEIVASDIDSDVLETAKNGVYHKERLNEIPDIYHSYLNYGKGEVEDWFRIDPKIKNKIKFCWYNLVGDKIINGGPFDVIFCRNVFIYFSPETIQEVVMRMLDYMPKVGYLFIGHSESLQGLEQGKTTIRVAPAVYRKG